MIITRNEAANIVDCIASAKLISEDIIVIDSCSCDDTACLAECSGAKVVSIVWNGYGNARNIGADYTLHNWILALDADERITPELAACIRQIHLNRPENVYGFKRLNYVEGKKICYGALGFDSVFRLYNKSWAEWEDVPVHESLTGRWLRYYTLPGKVIHYGNNSLEDYWQKKMKYASLWATKQKQKGKKYSSVKQLASTITSFLKAYILQLGFLDLKYGLKFSKMNARYTWHKYNLLFSLLKVNDTSSVEEKIKEDPMLISFAAK